MSIDERDAKSSVEGILPKLNLILILLQIDTCLPVSAEAHESGTVQNGSTLEDTMRAQYAAQRSLLAAVVLVTHFCGLSLNHLHHPEPK